MTAWWGNLAVRERLLIIMAVSLTVLVAIWQLVLVPTLSARADAKVQLAASSQTLTHLQEAYMVLRAKGDVEFVDAAAPGLAADAFKTAVTRSATNKGLSISRLQVAGNGSVGLVFERADPRQIFFWLEDVDTRLGGQISRLTIERAAEGSVRVNVEIEGNST